MRVRALFGAYEGDPTDVVFAGAMSEINYETLEDEEYQRVFDGFKASAPDGTTDWREAWLEFDAPDLSVPPITATVKPATEQIASKGGVK